MSKYIRHSLVTLVMILCSFRALALDSNQAAALLSQTYHVQIESYYAINSFYNFSANFGDKELLDQTRSAIEEINGALNEIESSEAASELEGAIAGVSDDWQKYKKLLKTNIKIVSDSGYPDLRLVDDLAQTKDILIQKLNTLYQAILDLSSYNPPKRIKESRDAAILMATMMTKYSARTTSNVSQVFQGSENEKPIDQLAMDFDKNLKSIIADSSSNAESAKLLDKAETTWNFIKNSYINYNENNVNFVINLYSRKIIKTLEQATGQHLEKTS